jgi:Domain of unknown function (DU1801)
MIHGAHAIIYSKDADADRAFFRDVLKYRFTDAGHGWLIFALPPAEVAFHPSDDGEKHELYLMCDDVKALVVDMKKRGVATSAIHEERWGSLTQITLPSGGQLGIYQPKHASPLDAPAPSRRKPATKKVPAKKFPAKKSTARKVAKRKPSSASIEVMTAEQQLRGFIAKFAPANQRLIHALRKALRRRLPAANELVYDNYNFLVIAYCPTEKPTDSFFSIGADMNGANLFFGYNGAKLPDPHGVLQGTGRSNRFIRLESATTLDRPEVDALIASAIAVSKPMVEDKGRLIIRSISPKQRPRR